MAQYDDVGQLDIDKLCLSDEESIPKCPFEDLKKKVEYERFDSCPFHKKTHNALPEKQNVTEKPSFSHGFGLFGSKFTSELLQDIGGSDKIRQMTTRFYAHAFEDETLSKFIFDRDGAANHGQRLGDWIIELMGGEGFVWTESGRRGMRQVSHWKAWNSDRRDEKDRGKRFKLDDSRIWMRIMFWSAREVGLDQHKTFWKWYTKFIQRGISIYTSSAPSYTKSDAEWSSKQSNIDKYIKNGCAMKDLIGIGRY